jgi:hypothetical protein
MPRGAPQDAFRDHRVSSEGRAPVGPDGAITLSALIASAPMLGSLEARTRKSGRHGLNVRFALKAIELPRGREMSRCALPFRSLVERNRLLAPRPHRITDRGGLA